MLFLTYPWTFFISPQGNWRFEGDNCATIQELILKQHMSRQPVTNKSKAILNKPVVREHWELQNDDIQLHESIGQVSELIELPSDL